MLPVIIFIVIELKISRIHSTNLQMHFSWKQSYQFCCSRYLFYFEFFVCISFKRYIFWYNGSKNESLKNRTYFFQRVTASTRETKVMVAVSHAKLIDEVFSVSRKKTNLAYTVQRSFIAVRSDNRLVKDLSMVSTWNFPELISFTITRIILLMT